MAAPIPSGADPRLYQQESVEQDIPSTDEIKKDLDAEGKRVEQHVPLKSPNSFVKPENFVYLPGGRGIADLPKTKGDMLNFQARAGGYASPDEVPLEYKRNPPPPSVSNGPGKVVGERDLGGAGIREVGWKPYRPG